MKKKTSGSALEKRLRVVRQTVRELTPTELGHANGGITKTCGYTMGRCNAVD